MRHAVVYARLLDAGGNKAAVIKVLETTLTHNPQDAKLTAYLGKELVLSGRAQAGIGQLNKAIAAGENNWKVYSALGSAYDQTGEHRKARAAYQSAHHFMEVARWERFTTSSIWTSVLNWIACEMQAIHFDELER